MLSKNLRKVVDSVAVAKIRKYLRNRIGLIPEKGKENELMEKVAKFIETLNEMRGTDLWQYASEREKKLAKKFVSKYPEILSYLTADNVLKWLMHDCPIAFGILVAHPNGLKWLDEVLANLVSHLLEEEVELVELEEASERSGQGQEQS